MKEYHHKLLNLNDNKLIDVVKNYRQYGYDEELRNTAIELLKERGITKEQLEFTGDFENKAYTKALELYRSFRKSSTIAFILYGAFVVFNIVSSMSSLYDENIELLLISINLLVLVAYFAFLIRSFVYHNQFYSTIKRQHGMSEVLFYIFVGMPLYIIMYFYFRNQMRDKMKEVR